jgi:prolyl-tRNA synthetase
MMVAYLRTFAKMGLTAVPVRADTGPIGGDLSHEFHIVASTGESQLFYDKALDEIMAQGGDPDINRLMELYAMEESMHHQDTCPVKPEDLRQARGIEVGHIFYFGTKYSQALGLKVTSQTGEMITPHMGSYGIGVSRLVGAIIEASHDEKGIIWPTSVAPFKVGLINLKTGDEACDKACEALYEAFTNAGITVLYDDRDERAGAKFATMDLVGLPWQVRVGPKGLADNMVELKSRRSDVVESLSPEAAINTLTTRLAVS